MRFPTLGGCCCSVAKLYLTLWDPTNCSTPGFPVLYHLLEFAQTYVHWVDGAILCCALFLLPSVFPRIRVFSSELALWSHSFSISPSNEYSGLISFRIDWFDLLAFQGTLKSLLQHHILKASVLQCSAFFMVQFSHPYITPGKTIALTIWTFVGKVVSLLLNMLSRLVIAFLPRQASFVCSEFGAQENKLCQFPFFPHLFAMKWWDQIPWSLNVEF